MRTLTINIYQYDELSDIAKEKVLHRFYDINVDHDWWDYTCDDAERIGVKITGFDLERNRSIIGKFILSAQEVAERILKEHGETCNTYKLAEKYIPKFQWYCKKMEEESLSLGQEANFNNLENRFLRELLEEYSIMLKKEYEYLTSQEAIEETIRANQYEFTKDGSLFT